MARPPPIALLTGPSTLERIMLAPAAQPAPFADAVLHLRHRATRERNGEPFTVWSFLVIDDLRPRAERGGDE